MELKPIYRRVVGLDVHQAKISACAITNSVYLAPDNADEDAQRPPRKINHVGLNRR